MEYVHSRKGKKYSGINSFAWNPNKECVFCLLSPQWFETHCSGSKRKKTVLSCIHNIFLWVLLRSIETTTTHLLIVVPKQSSQRTTQEFRFHLYAFFKQNGEKCNFLLWDKKNNFCMKYFLTQVHQKDNILKKQRATFCILYYYYTGSTCFCFKQLLH